MRIGIASDHGGFGLKEDLHERPVTAGHEVVDFGSNTLNSGDDYPDLLFPLHGPLQPGDWSGEWPSAAVVWAPQSAPTRLPECAPPSLTITSPRAKELKMTT